MVRQAATGADLRRMAVTATPDRIPRAIAAVGGEYRPGQSECGIEGVSAGAGQGEHGTDDRVAAGEFGGAGGNRQWAPRVEGRLAVDEVHARACGYVRRVPGP